MHLQAIPSKIFKLSTALASYCLTSGVALSNHYLHSLHSQYLESIGNQGLNRPLRNSLSLGGLSYPIAKIAEQVLVIYGVESSPA